VFAPTDEAFAALPEGTIEALLADPEALAAILTYHVVAGKVMSTDLTDGMMAATVNGAEVTIGTGRRRDRERRQRCDRRHRSLEWRDPRHRRGDPAAALTYAECVMRIALSSDIAKQLSRAGKSALIPRSSIRQFKAALDKTSKALQNIEAALTNVEVSCGGSRTFNYETFHLHANNGQSFDLRQYFSNPADSTDGLLEALVPIYSLARPTKGSSTFQAAADTLAAIIQTATSELNTIRATSSSLGKTLKSTNESAESAQNTALEIKRMKDDAATDRKSISEYAAEATEKRASIDAVAMQASSLEKTVREYSEKFESFQRQLMKERVNSSKEK
jgi:hypothetical protein